MIAYFYKSYSDSESQYFNANFKEDDKDIISLSGVHFELNFSEQDILNKSNEIASLFPDYILTNTIIDYGDQ